MVFDVDHISGQLVVAGPIDRESMSEYQLEIHALDSSSVGNPQSMAVSVIIEIEDVNDNPPRWPCDPILIEVSEGALVGSTLFNLTASDLDQGPNGELRYGLVSETPFTGSFAVDSLAGGLILMKPLDHEERSEFTLVLKAEDRALPNERLIATISARLVVLDLNDNDPHFVIPNEPTTVIDISSDTPPGQLACSSQSCLQFSDASLLTGSLLLRILAIDKDAGENGRVSYAIISGNEDGCIAVNRESGELTLMKHLQKAISEIEITASDHGFPQRSNTIRLTFSVTSSESNNLLSRLLLSNPMLQISENLQVGSELINVAAPNSIDQGKIIILTLISFI